MEALIMQLKALLSIKDSSQDELLNAIMIQAAHIYAMLAHPVGDYQVDAEGVPVMDARCKGWVVRCSVELYNKMGAEGQLSHSENGISRSYDAGDISQGLKQQVKPVVVIVG